MTTSRELIEHAKASVTAIPRRPRSQQAVVTCQDARIDPVRIFGAAPGDMNVIRNAGGLVTPDVVNGLLVSQYRLGTTRIDLVMHTDCGMLGFDSEALAEEVRAATGQRLRTDLAGFDDLHAELLRGVATLRGNPALLHRDEVRGFVYHIEDGRLEVVAE